MMRSGAVDVSTKVTPKLRSAIIIVAPLTSAPVATPGVLIVEITCGAAHYFASTNTRPAWPNVSAVMLRQRNWIYDRVLSGDIIVEQNIHVIDICNWVMRGHPVKAAGTAMTSAPCSARRR